MVKQLEVDNSFEVSWKGTISSLGKDQSFFIENLLISQDGFKGCMTYDDNFFILQGGFIPEGSKGDMAFRLEALYNKKVHYVLTGAIKKYSLEIIMESTDFSLNIPRLMSLDFKSVPVTIYSEPYKTIYVGRAKISDIIFVIFYINDCLNIFSGKKSDGGAYVVEHLRNGHSLSDGTVILKQVRTPSRCTLPGTMALLDERSQIGYIIEPHTAN